MFESILDHMKTKEFVKRVISITFPVNGIAPNMIGKVANVIWYDTSEKFYTGQYTDDEKLHFTFAFDTLKEAHEELLA